MISFKRSRDDRNDVGLRCGLYLLIRDACLQPISVKAKAIRNTKSKINFYASGALYINDKMEHPIDPVNLLPIPPLIDSYTYHSQLPSSVASSSASNKVENGWIMGIDEAGRGRGSHSSKLSFEADLYR